MLAMYYGEANISLVSRDARAFHETNCLVVNMKTEIALLIACLILFLYVLKSYAGHKCMIVITS